MHDSIFFVLQASQSSQATGARPYSRIHVSLEALLPHRWVRATSRRRRGDHHLEGRRCRAFGSPSFRTSPFRPTTFMPPIIYLLDYFAFLRRPFRIPNTHIYISFRAAQDYNKAAGWDTTLSTTSSTRREDSVATTWCHSSCFAFVCRSFDFGFACHEL
jgi:hypothetical protein